MQIWKNMDMFLGLKSWESIVWISDRLMRPDFHIYIQRNTSKILMDHLLYGFTSVFWCSWDLKLLVRTPFYDSTLTYVYYYTYEFSKYHFASCLILISIVPKIVIPIWMGVHVVIFVVKVKSSFNSIRSCCVFK